MREHKIIEKTVIKQILFKITCNKCGKNTEETEQSWSQKYQKLQMSFGYGSQYDMETWKIDLCEDCLTELVKTFKHVPEGFGEDNQYAKYPQIMFEQWKESGEINLEAGNVK